MENNPEKYLPYFLKESSIASINLASGLNGLRAAGISQKGRYYQAFFGLSIGLERLLKLILILDYKTANGTFPENTYVKNYKHSIKDIFEWVLSKYTAVEGWREIKADSIYSEILNVLQDFAEQTRYANLDYITGKTGAVDALFSWNKNINKEIIKRHFKPSKVPSELARTLKDNASFYYYDEVNTAVQTGNHYLKKSFEEQTLRKYSVVYVGAILAYLSKILSKVETTVCPGPSEYFVLFDQARKFYLTRKNWNPYRI